MLFMFMSVPVYPGLCGETGRKAESIKAYRCRICSGLSECVIFAPIVFWHLLVFIFSLSHHAGWFTHLLLVGGCNPSECSFIPEYKAVKKRGRYIQKKKKKRNTSWHSVFWLFVGVWKPLGLYWFYGINRIRIWIFEAGIVVFVSVLLWALAGYGGKYASFGRKQRYIKNMAQEDSDDRYEKTGNAYEKYFEDLEDGICNWKNAVLIFMDLAFS